tara:strand:- start:1057 stop:1491 length:435 start_codon:yes stop_codon:yes gene_type:complete
MIVDYKFLEDNIDEFIKIYFEFNNDNRARKKQYTDRWLNTIGRESNSKDKVKISEPTILYIQEIIKLRHEKAEGRKLIKNNHIKNLENRIASLEKQINKLKNMEVIWRAITQVLSKNLKDINPQGYYQLIETELQDVNKGYYGL